MTDKPLPPNSLSIEMYLHCRRCLGELPDGESPESWARLSVGLTPIGLQVWCVRHDINVFHLDFEGQNHPANNSAPTH
jgi:hypothetical protein